MAKKIHVRPGKSQSKIGFVVGIIFCLIGLFIAIPTFGLFGVFWTAVAGWITYTHYRNGFTDKHIDSQVIEIENDGNNDVFLSHSGLGTEFYNTRDKSNNDSDDVEERLRKLQNLYDQALITREEYDQKRREILNDL